ncbi:hypothetical protein EDB81DRAFT_789824 [Dactylonectria macrodidyma]|uniref:Uncharacterized protein n=1 Tax=Dactylonectria macrodidyma TaxID=307937 RepID=A0A9P9F546_9HYPO|nr:hypothetical protein EDB81DRAFT_789824 [Dactylonectria macrodidyma]
MALSSHSEEIVLQSPTKSHAQPLTYHLVTLPCLALQTLILEGQRDAEREALRHGRWIISDRSTQDPIVYARRYSGHKTAEAIGVTAA